MSSSFYPDLLDAPALRREAPPTYTDEYQGGIVQVLDYSKVYDFESGARGLTDARIRIHGQLLDDTVEMPPTSEGVKLKGDLIVIDGKDLLSTQNEVYKYFGLTPTSSSSELELARTIHRQGMSGETIEGVAYRSVLVAWEKKAQYARHTMEGSTVLTFLSHALIKQLRES